MQLVSTELRLWCNASPEVAVLPVNVQLVTAVALWRLSIPPPLVAELPMNVQLVTVGLLALMLDIPPPIVAWFPINSQSVTMPVLPS